MEEKTNKERLEELMTELQGRMLDMEKAMAELRKAYYKEVISSRKL